MAAVSVGTAATLLVTGAGRVGSAKAFAIMNNGANAIFLGDSTVTTATGFPLAPGDPPFAGSLPAGRTIYGVVAASTEEARTITAG